MGDRITIDDSDAFLIGFGASAISWSNRTFPLCREFLLKFLDLYNKMVGKYLYDPALFTPSEKAFVDEALSALRKAFRDHPNLPDIHDLGNSNNSEFFKNNHSIEECKLWVISELPKSIINYTSKLLSQMLSIEKLLVDNPYWQLGRIIASVGIWHQDHQPKVQEILNAMEQLGIGNEILRAKYKQELICLFEDRLPNAKKLFGVENTLCGALYSPSITKIPYDEASNGIFAAIYRENERELSANVNKIRNAIKSQLGVELPSDINLCLSYLTMHYTFIIAIGVRTYPYQPFHFSRHYIFEIISELFTLVHGYIRQANEPHSLIGVQGDANSNSTVRDKVNKAPKKMQRGIVFGTVYYEIDSKFNDFPHDYSSVLNDVEIEVHGKLNGKPSRFQFTMFDPHSYISKAAEQLFIIAASNGGIFTNEDMYHVMSAFKLKFTKDMASQVRNRLNFSILKSICQDNETYNGKRKKVFYCDRGATKTNGSIQVVVNNTRSDGGKCKLVANTVFTTHLRFKNMGGAPDEIIEYESEPNYDRRDMR